MSTQPDAQALIDLAIGAAPSCVRHRMFLHTIDWSKAAPAQVERLLAVLAEAKVALPAWLAKALLIGGHALGDAHDALDAGIACAERHQPARCGRPGLRRCGSLHYALVLMPRW